MALHDLYARLGSVKPTPHWLKALLVIGCIPLLFSHIVLNIIPSSHGAHIKAPIVQSIWAILLASTYTLFAFYAFKLGRVLERVQATTQTSSVRVTELVNRLRHCAAGMMLELVVLIVFVRVAWYGPPRLMVLASSFAFWTSIITSLFKIRALIEKLPEDQAGRAFDEVNVVLCIPCCTQTIFCRLGLF